MKSEFVRLTPPESIYAEKNLLYSELEVLNSTRHLLNYKTLKKEENQLKIILKQETKSALDLLKSLDKALPKMKMPKPLNSNETTEIEMQEPLEPTELESELQRIKEKLSKLQS